MSQPLVSIVIPVYNGARTLARCLESVSRSIYPFYECIVVDDDSSDETPNIAKSFDTKLIRLQGRNGAAYARNRGAEAAQGEIFLFLDADVTIPPDCLVRVVKTFGHHLCA